MTEAGYRRVLAIGSMAVEGSRLSRILGAANEVQSR